MHGGNNGEFNIRKDKFVSLILYSSRLESAFKGTYRSSTVCLDLSRRWAERRNGRGGGAVVSICASLDSAVMRKRKRGITEMWLSQQNDQ